MAREKICGIYKIENLVNGKIYIGSSVDISERWHRHSTDLRTNRHGNDYLQNAWNKHGEDNFKFEIIEYINDISILINREQYWIDQLNACKRSIGYNLSPTAGSPYGFKHTDETKLKQSKLQSKNRKPILQIDLNGNIIREWSSITQIGRETEYKERAIKDVALGLRGYIAYNYIWIYKSDYNVETFNLQSYMNNKHQSKRVIQFDLDGNIIKHYDSLTDVVLCNDSYRIQSICNVCTIPAFKSYKGCMWMFEIDYLQNGILPYKRKPNKSCCKKIIQLDKENNFIKIWESTAEASKFYKISPSSIFSCLENKTKFCNGYNWIREENYNITNNTLL